MNEKLIISVFVGIEGVHAYSIFLPSVIEIQTFAQDDNGIMLIREGEIMASMYLIIFAIAVSYITRSKWPAIMALITGAAMIGVYEYALTRSPIRRNGEEDCGCNDGYTYS